MELFEFDFIEELRILFGGTEPLGGIGLGCLVTGWIQLVVLVNLKKLLKGVKRYKNYLKKFF